MSLLDALKTGLIVKIGSDLSGLKTGIIDAGNELNKLDASSKKSQESFKTAGLVIGGAMTGIGVSAVLATNNVQTSFRKFDDAMVEVKALGGVTTEEFKQMGDAAIDLSRKYPIAADDVANSMYLMTSVGYDYQTMMKTMPEASKLAVAGSMEMKDATNAVINVLGAYGDKAGDAGDITKVFANSVGVGKYEMTDFMTEIMKNIGIASQLGISFSDLAAYNVSLQNSFTNAEEAGTSLNRMMISLADPQAVIKLKKLGVEVTDENGKFRDLTAIMGDLKGALSNVSNDAERVGKLTDIFGTFGFRAADAMMRQTDTLPELKTQMSELNLIEDQTNTKLEGFSNKLEIADNKMEAAKIRMGEAMVPATLALADGMSGLADTIDGLPGPLQDVAGTGMYLSQAFAVSGPLILGLTQMPQLLTGVRAGLTLLSAHPIILVLTIVIASLILLEMKFGLVSKAVAFLGKGFDWLVGVVSGFITWMTTAVNWSDVLYTSFLVLLGPIGWIQLAMNKLGISWGDVWNGMVNIATAAKGLIIGVVNAMVGGVKWAVNIVIDGINTMIRGLNSLRFNVPDWVPYIGGNTVGFNVASIPRLAEGGIVTQPTIAMIGEAGPEAVIPLNGSNAGGVGGPTLNFYGPINVRNDQDIPLIAQELKSLIDRETRSRGAPS